MAGKRRYEARPLYAIETGAWKSELPDVPYALISVTTPGDNSPSIPEDSSRVSVLRLVFDDLSYDEKDEREAAELRELLGRDSVLFNTSHALKILDFVEMNGDADIVLVHCGAGVSRSPAIAAAMTKAEGGDDSRFFKQGVPNMRVYTTLLRSAEERKESLCREKERFLLSIPSFSSRRYGKLVRLVDIPNPLRSEFGAKKDGIPAPVVEGEGWCAYFRDLEKWTEERFSLSWRGFEPRIITDSEARKNPVDMFFENDGGEAPFGAFGFRTSFRY